MERIKVAPQPMPTPAVVPEIKNLKAATLTQQPGEKVSLPMFTLGDTPPMPTASAGKYPVFVDNTPGKDVIQTATRVKVNAVVFDSIEGSLKTDKAFLVERTMPYWFQSQQGKSDPASSVSIQTGEGEVLVTFADKFKIASSPQAVAAIVGAAAVTAHFYQAYEIKISGDDLPQTADTQVLLNELKALFTKHGVAHALQFKSSIKPKKGFNKTRHVLFTPEQNIAINAICPMIPLVKTKGRND